MPVDFNTNHADWRAHLRENDIFVALASPSWQRSLLHQAQLAYARQLGKPIYLLVRENTQAPTLREGEHVYYFATPEDCATLVQEIVDGTR